MRILTAIALSLVGAVAANAPAADVAPGWIYGIYAKRVSICFSDASSKTGRRCEGDALSHVLIAPVPSSEVRVELSIVQGPEVECTARAFGRWEGNRLVATHTSQNPGTNTCRFAIDFRDKQILITDLDPPCRPIICSRRGQIDGVTLPKRGSF